VADLSDVARASGLGEVGAVGGAVQRLGHAARRWDDSHRAANSSGVGRILEPRPTKVWDQTNLLSAIFSYRVAVRLPLLELQLVPFGLGFNRVAGGKLAFQDGETERIQQNALDHPFQGASAIDRVVTFFGQ
jgi:hypothetical protein